MLEDRRLLSTVTDTSDSASDPNSLRYHILNDAAGSTIQFASSLAGETITLASALPSITKPLTIVGLGASQLTIDGSKVYSAMFTFTANATASISGLTIANSKSNLDYNNGGGINNAGSLTVSDCVLSTNYALDGGGIYFDGEYGGTLTVNNSVFSGNRAKRAAASITPEAAGRTHSPSPTAPSQETRQRVVNLRRPGYNHRHWL